MVQIHPQVSKNMGNLAWSKILSRAEMLGGEVIQRSLTTFILSFDLIHTAFDHLNQQAMNGAPSSRGYGALKDAKEPLLIQGI